MSQVGLSWVAPKRLGHPVRAIRIQITAMLTLHANTHRAHDTQKLLFLVLAVFNAIGTVTERCQ